MKDSQESERLMPFKTLEERMLKYKKELEAKVAELEKSKKILQRAVSTDPNFGEMQRTAHTKYCAKIDAYKEILLSAIVLPVIESWSNSKIYSGSTFLSISEDYPNGVIIQPK
jgi:hypothetical protein